jgi:hypothetical protein
MNRELRVLMLAAALTFAAAHPAQAELARKQVLLVQQYIETGDIDGLNRFINNNNWIFGGDTPLERALVEVAEALSLRQPVEIATNKLAILVEQAVKSTSIY